jgi:ferredoxin
MNKKKALKILEGLKEIQDECRLVGDCTECEFYLDGRYSENCLFDWNLDGDYELPCDWRIDEKIDEIKEAIKLDEVLAKKGD